ncbi:carboxypeptidase-like regulatory domain-containing protein [Flavobacterium sp.]|uniref:carboxypeptidase-like regulatory domain-containing protein n=1 Tax=Flavobacterium sp. TaxID=239 RepID=UPI004047D701
MIKYIIILFFNFSIYAQINIHGKITGDNKEPISGASVYVNGTTIGAITDLNGDFNFSIPNEINALIITSHIGYKTAYSEIKKESFVLNVTLESDVTELKEVVLSQNRFSRDEILTLFKDCFLGTTKAGKKCSILNEDDLYFTYDTDNFILMAHSDRTLEIDNSYLGYKVNYTLLDFKCKLFKLSIKEKDVVSNSFGGYSNFKETDTTEVVQKRREESYKGSVLHLFRNLSNESWSKDEFALFESAYMVDSKDHFKIKNTTNNLFEVTIQKQNKSLRNKGFVAEFSILYNKKEHSKIYFYTTNFIIDSFGLYTNYDKVYFSGEISKRKVGDLLPSNYGL